MITRADCLATEVSRMNLEQSSHYCRTLALSHYENFSIASCLVPKSYRRHLYHVYAYCRWSDDIADEVEEHRRLPLLDWWHQQLSLCYSGRPAHPVMLALQQTIQRHQIPVETLEDLLSAFRQDQSTLRYRNDSELFDYCRRSANPVGRVILKFAKADSESNVNFSDSICTGLQLANFCQDLSRDAANNRIYAPANLWAKHGVSEAMILETKCTPQLQAMLVDWVHTAREFFSRGCQLVDCVPKWLAVDMDLFIRGGLGILNAIEAQHFDVWTSRPTLSKFTKFRFLCQSLVFGFFKRSHHG